MVDFAFSFTGNNASRAQLDFYDASRALIGFQRSLALTVHLAANGEIITQAPSLKNASVLISPPRKGSWEIVASTFFGVLGASALAPKDSVLGHFTRSLYDYLLNASLGIEVDFDKTIRQQHEDLCKEKKITEAKLDSLVEKTENAIIDMHRPVIFSGTAQKARVLFEGSKTRPVGPVIDVETYEFVRETIEAKRPVYFSGAVSSYNSNTYKGRVYVSEEGRSVPFELAGNCKGLATIKDIMASLELSALDRRNSRDSVAMKAFRRESSTGRLKSFWVVEVAHSISGLD